MAQHTPGPWEMRPIPGMNQIAIARPDLMYPFASVGPWVDSREPHRNLTDTDYGNATLIAAAPEMLDALEQAEACMSIVEPRSDKAEYLRILGAVRAAIAKAEGRS